MKILVATSNPGKIREINEILSSLDITILTPQDIDIQLDVIEDGKTFAENASIKALAWRKASGIPSLADDSGLCVDSLNGRPGVMSARFAGDGATDKDNYELLLKYMDTITERSARFVCAVAVAFVQDEVVLAEGEYKGTILDAPVGEGGFGYDPVFFDPVSKKSFAQLTPEEKNERSHRRRALEALRKRLEVSGYFD